MRSRWLAPCRRDWIGRLALCLACVLWPTGRIQAEPVADEAGKTSFSVDVFVSGTGGYHTYRIPSLLVAADGSLLAFCEGRKTSREDLGDNDLLLRRSTDGGRAWGPMQLVHEEGGDARITIANPTAVLDRDTKRVWLVMQRNGRDVLITYSDDHGAHWAPVVDITSQVKKPEWGFYAVGPGVGIQIRHGRHRGRLVVPAYHRATSDKSGPSTSHVFFSDDHGMTWQLGGNVGPHTNECQVVEIIDHGESVLLLNARNHWGRSGQRPEWEGVRIVARSHDGGATWDAPEFDRALVEPQCQASLIRWREPEGDRPGCVLFANPASRGRDHLTIKASFDEGRTWPVQRLIHAGSSAYSSLCALPDGNVGILYERDAYGKLTFAVVPASEFFPD